MGYDKAKKKAYDHIRYLRDREKIILRVKIWEKANPDKRNAIRRKYHRNHPDVRQRDNRNQCLRRHGLTLEDFNSRFQRQHGKCAVCEDLLVAGRKTGIDHDHITGRIRGLLCINCNALLGHAKDSTDILQKAINYLRVNG